MEPDRNAVPGLPNDAGPTPGTTGVQRFDDWYRDYSRGPATAAGSRIDRGQAASAARPRVGGNGAAAAL